MGDCLLRLTETESSQPQAIMTGPFFFGPIQPMAQRLHTHHHPTRFTIDQPARPPPRPLVVPPLAPEDPTPCLPPPGSCPHPDRPRHQADHRDPPHPIPEVTITDPTPPSSPPAYVLSSPPKYATFPSGSSEQTLLLGPPPSFESLHRCPESHICETKRADWVVRALIVLNILVWATVIWGYYLEWNGMDVRRGLCGGWGLGPASSTFGGVWPSCVEGPDGVGGELVTKPIGTGGGCGLGS